MTLKINSISARNFLSFGNVTQTINLDRNDLTLVLGENLDLGGDDTGSRNAVGKSSILNCVSYALYGLPISNIKRDNLINRTNNKNMVVTIEFEKDNIVYRIERGRKPNIMKLWIGTSEQTFDDDAQGDNRETQKSIDRVIGMSHDMFKHVVALNTYTEPFLNLRTNEQRTIIEQLLGITLLSEKSDLLKELIKTNKDDISKEEYRVNAVISANKRFEEQIDNLKQRQKVWNDKRLNDITASQEKLENLLTIDIDQEIAAHKQLTIFKQYSRDISSLVSSLEKENILLAKEQKNLDKIKKEISLLNDHKCHSCGQELHDDVHHKLVALKNKNLIESEQSIISHNNAITHFISEIEKLGPELERSDVFYKNEEDAFKHRSTVDSLIHQLETSLNSQDPYTEQIAEMQEKAVEKIDYSVINDLTRLKEHREFLLKLLTSKDSFIRKRIIEQNLSYLNVRLSQYLDKAGLPHTVIFQNDLSVCISELGRELDFQSMSRGEMTRVIISLSLAFRDVWEASFHSINLLFIDELVDQGMDALGAELILKLLKGMSRDRNKSVWLISHKDEFSTRVDNICKVIKENGFTRLHMAS